MRKNTKEVNSRTTAKMLLLRIPLITKIRSGSLQPIQLNTNYHVLFLTESKFESSIITCKCILVDDHFKLKCPRTWDDIPFILVKKTKENVY